MPFLSVHVYPQGVGFGATTPYTSQDVTCAACVNEAPRDCAGHGLSNRAVALNK